MKLLIVCSFNRNRISPFVYDQVESIIKHKIIIKFFKIKGHGIGGYLKNYLPLLKEINNYRPDMIHAHYGLSGLLANMQRKVPVITTFHGSDLNNHRVFKYSKLAKKMSRASIFVSPSLATRKIDQNKNYIIPCGVDLLKFNSLSKNEARCFFGFEQHEIIVLFSSSFDNEVKNYILAKKSCEQLEANTRKKVKLIELKNYSRKEVNLLFNATDCALLTSFSEGSPQFIKEAMACNRPIVTTDVGDVRFIIGDTPGCFLTTYDPEDVAGKLKSAIEYSETKLQTGGRDRIIALGLDSETVAKRIIKVYKSVLRTNLHHD